MKCTKHTYWKVDCKECEEESQEQYATTNTSTNKASRMKLFIHLFFILATIGGVLSYVPIDDTNRGYVESRVYNTSDSYIINYTETGVEYRANSSERVGVRVVKGIGMYTIEADPHVGQIIRILDNNTLTFTTFENPLNPYPSSRIPLRVCMSNNEAQNANRFETDLPYCDHDKEYYLGNVQVGSTYTVRLLESLYNTSSLIWWLGADDLDGTYGQGGGLPTCDFVFADIYRNQTQTYVGNSFIMGMKWDAVGTGCGASALYEESYTSIPAWKTIPTINSSDTNLQCLSGSCYKTSPAFDTWYYRTVKCKWEGNRSLRVRVASRDTFYNSPTRNMECLNVPTPVSDDGLGAWWIYAFPFMLLSMIIMIFLDKEVVGRDIKKTLKDLRGKNGRKEK